MGSISDSVGSARRYASIHSGLQRWSNRRIIADVQPQLEAHVSRVPALDLAHQAQVAACNYLGFSPREFANSIYRQQAITAESPRPLELHMHHHHHHYVASPTSPFSQASSSTYFGEAAAELVTTSANDLTIRVSSPQPAATTATATTYPALGMHGSAVGAPYLLGIPGQGFVQNTSHGLLQSHGTVEPAQRLLQNVLWLKNQITEDDMDQPSPRFGQDVRGGKKVVREIGMMGMDAGSSKTRPFQAVTSEYRSSESGNKRVWSRHCDGTQYGSEVDPLSDKERFLDSTKSGRTSSILDNANKIEERRGYHGPHSSVSDDDSATEDIVNPSASDPHSSTDSSLQVALSSSKTKRDMGKNEETNLIVETSSSDIPTPQDKALSRGLTSLSVLHSSQPKSMRMKSEPDLGSRRNILMEDTSTSMEDEAYCRSDTVSARRYKWKCSSGSEKKCHKFSSPLIRPAKKSCCARVSRRQASREARAWESQERKPPKSFYQGDERANDNVIEYEMDSQAEVGEKTRENKRNHVHEEDQLSFQDKPTQRAEREDAETSREQDFERGNCCAPELENMRKSADNGKLEWITRAKRTLQDTYDDTSRRGIDHLKAEYLQDTEFCSSFCGPTSDEIRPKEQTSQNRFREAVEAAWRTNLGTKTRPQDEELQDVETYMHGTLEDKFQGILKTQTVARVAAEEKAHVGVEHKAPEYEVLASVETAARAAAEEKARVAADQKTCVYEASAKAQIIARVAAEEKARIAAEKKACVYEASAKAAEEGLRGLLDERALFHAKFKEELEQGVTDRLRLQELLQLEKLKLEATERELREVKRSFQESLSVGTKLNKKYFQEPKLDVVSLYPIGSPSILAGRNDSHLKLISESEARMAAEAKASYFEASAKAAEEKLRSLLDERNRFNSKCKDELENKNTDTMKLQQLMELDNSHPDCTDLVQKRKVDVRALVAPSVARKPTEKVAEDGKRVAQNGFHNRASFHARLKQELEEEDEDRHRLHRLLELEESKNDVIKEMHKGGNMILQNEPIGSISKEIKRDFEDDWMPASSCTVQNPDENAHCESENLKTDRNGPLSPVVNSRVWNWGPEDPSSLKIERSRDEAAEMSTVFDKSPNFNNFEVVTDFHSPKEYHLRIATLREDLLETAAPRRGPLVTAALVEDHLEAADPRKCHPEIEGPTENYLEASAPGENILEKSDPGENTLEKSAPGENLLQESAPAENLPEKSAHGEYLLEKSDHGENRLEISAPGENRLENSAPGENLVDNSATRECHLETATPEEYHSEIAGVPDKAEHRDWSSPIPCADLKIEDNPCIIVDPEIRVNTSSGSVLHDGHLYAGREPNLDASKNSEGSDDVFAWPMLLPAEWKKAAKAELRKIIQEQELTWKTAEDAMEELGRRLELLESYKIEQQESLGRTRAMGIVDGFWTHLEEKFEEFPRGFNSLYNSPIFEERNAQIKQPGKFFQQAAEPATVTPERELLEASVNILPEKQQMKDYEIEKLKADLLELRRELTAWGKNRDGSFKVKEDSQNAHHACIPTLLFQPNPTPPIAPNCPANYLLVYKESLADQQLPLVICPGSGLNISEVLERVIEPERADTKSEKITGRTMQATKTVTNSCASSKVNREDHHEKPSSKGSLLGDRYWVPVPDNKSREEIVGASGDNHTDRKSSQLIYINGAGSAKDYVLSRKLSSKEGELEVLKDAVHKLSNIFWDKDVNRNVFHEEGKQSFFQVSVADAEADSSHSLDLRNFYVDLLKEMSQQLGELCCDLQKNSHDHENCGSKGTMVPSVIAGSETEKLRTALEAAEHQIQEELSINRELKKKLEDGDKYMSKLLEDHAAEVLRKEKTISYAEQLNLQLASEMSQTESSLAELRARYKGLLANLESQLEEARNEVTGLQNTINGLKSEVDKYEVLISDLERTVQEKELHIQELTTVKQACQVETDTVAIERLELLKAIQDMRREADEQQHYVTELVSINEELLLFAENKEVEVKRLNKEVMSLQQSLKGMSDEANKIAMEAAKFSGDLAEAIKERESYRLRCKFLKSKLEETDQELLAREDALERLTRHLGSTIEGQDLISEEKEQLLLSLNKAHYKEHRLDDQVRQSKIIIEDMEEKLSFMEAEIQRARIEMTELRVKGEESLAIKKEAGEMRKRVHHLEEEIMEKEGQISILKSSFPGENGSSF